MNRTCIHNVVHTDINNRAFFVFFTAVYITSLYYGVPRVKILQYICICLIFLSEGLLYEFLNLSTGGWKPNFCQLSTSAKTQQMNWRMKAAFCQEVSAGSDVLGMGEMNKVLWLAWHNDKKMPVCDGLSLPPLDTRMHWHENYHFVIFFTFLGIIFHHGQYSLIGRDKLCPMCNNWQLYAF